MNTPSLSAAEDFEPFDWGSLRFHLKRHNLTGQHRAAWKHASTLQKAMEERTPQTRACVAQLDALLASGALTPASYDATRKQIDNTTVALLRDLEAALDVLLDLHLIGWEDPLNPREAMPPCDAHMRRKLPAECKLALGDEVRRRLLVDFGPVEAAKRFGLWGRDLATVAK